MRTHRKAPPPEKPATCRSIAAACGLSKATVARALNGHPNVSPATRELALETAAKLGYRPDPSLAALARRRWPHGPKVESVTLAWIYYNGGSRPKQREFLGAASRAAELGYHFDTFNLVEYLPGKALNRILWARGIQGVLLEAFNEAIQIDLDWSRFCTVFVGPENDEIHVHNVQADFRATVRMAVRACLERGYRRPGFALMDYHASGTNEPILAQATLERSRLFARLGAQPEFFHWNPSEKNPPAAFFHWLQSERPDAVIASHPLVYYWMNNPLFYDCPNFTKTFPKPGLVSLREDDLTRVPALTHANLRYSEQGREAVNLVHAQLRHGLLGIPSVPMRMLIPPAWVAGKTLPFRGKPAPAQGGREKTPDGSVCVAAKGKQQATGRKRAF